ncbi:response regulator [Natrialbaceae archaeon A-CW2]|uniref:hybrid sensor histidine kinase/response regulator n=1 Tax=Natronosalvus amylolyticus TaxID=2961994 RepID=UPI0020C95755|nr:hybrid sensor histidine kinase/response regulator [Natronosalvus amylolyticus]
MDTPAGVSLLLVEDNPDDARYVRRLLHEYQADVGLEDTEPLLDIEDVVHVDRLTAALEESRTGDVDVILLDLMLPDSTGLETVDAMVEVAPATPVVVLTGQNDGNVGVEAIRRGAQDYLVKGSITGELIHRAVRYAIERAETYRQLRDRNDRLALLNRLIRTDIRTDVNMIVGWGDQLKGRVGDDEEPIVDAILQAAHHGLELTDTAGELMDAIDGEDGVASSPCDVTSVLERELDRVETEFDGQLELSRDGVDTDEAVLVSGTQMLDSVFRHLLTNAATHTDRDPPRIAVGLEERPETVSVTIADEGVGLSASQRDTLADPERSPEDRIGMGVGLYLVTTVLDEIGGDLTLEENRPQGTVATVTLDRTTPLE